MVDTRLVALQKLAGVKEGDSEEGITLTLHFVLCAELAGLALKTATVGDTQRDSRYGRHMAEPLTEADMVRLGLRPARTVPPLQQQAASPAEGGAVPAAEGGGSQEAKAKESDKPEGDTSG